MSDEMTQQMMAAAERLATAAEALNRVLERIDAQQEALNAKVDRIVAAVEEQEGGSNDVAADSQVAESQEAESLGAESRTDGALQERVAELEKANTDLKAQATRLARKTLPAAVSALLGKFDGENGDALDAATIERTLQPLSVEQRIAVKAEMARAGLIE